MICVGIKSSETLQYHLAVYYCQSLPHPKIINSKHRFIYGHHYVANWSPLSPSQQGKLRDL